MRATEAFRQSMYSKIREWQSSGLSQKAFCEQQTIKYFVFHYWYKQYRDEQKGEPDKFIQLTTSVASHDIFAELALHNGNRLIFHQPVPLDYFSTLLK
jgi:hypothetical protein